MNLGQCLRGLDALNPVDGQLPVSGIRSDSRLVEPGDLFVSLAEGSGVEQHVRQAFAKGATAALVDSASPIELPAAEQARICRVENLLAKASLVAGNFFAHPSRQMRLVGVTGTNGKTSLCSWLEFLLCQSGFRAASLGTLGVSLCGETLQPADGMTTRDAVESQRWLAQCLEQGADICAMEVSSHGLQQNRVAAVQYLMAVFTNFTRDHLDYHGTEQAYWLAKRSLFEMPGLQLAVVNLDDQRVSGLAKELRHRLKVVGYSIEGHPQAQVSAVGADFSRGIRFQLVRDGERTGFYAPWLVARFELSNLCAALAVALELGANCRDLVQAVEQLKPARGRLQPVGELAGCRLFVDYAHTPDAVANSLQALRGSAGGKLLAVLGCGGDRDPGKRPLMASAALAVADQLLITSDNPRSEPAEVIAAQMMAAVKDSEKSRVAVCLDRAAAIEQAVAMMSQGYSVALLGKGHENYQLVNGQRHHFDDAEIAAAAIVKAGGDVL